MKVDTRILVRDSVLERWKIGYFAKYEDGKVYTFSKGQTSYTSNGEMWSWDYAELSDLEIGIEWEEMESVADGSR